MSSLSKVCLFSYKQYVYSIILQRLPAVLSRIGIILASPLEVIESEFMAAINAEKPPDTPARKEVEKEKASHEMDQDDVEMGGGESPVKPPRRKISRTVPYETTINGNCDDEESGEKKRESGGPNEIVACTSCGGGTSPCTHSANNGCATEGEKKRESGGPNEIVACTSCGGGTSPCTHSANNGCATETCFVQVRKKEPPHPIRVAKTIDVIARITFPTAYAIFLIFFFIHYKGFS
uniref:Uncharacterized protein n=1 Tax=Lutzomyia longipalpis TaxID=7200 RepID=A0A1B0CWG9_LUTLO